MYNVYFAVWSFRAHRSMSKLMDINKSDIYLSKTFLCPENDMNKSAPATKTIVRRLFNKCNQI